MRRWRAGPPALVLGLLGGWLAQGCLVTLDSGVVSCDSQGGCPQGYQCVDGFCDADGSLPAGSSSGATAGTTGAPAGSGTTAGSGTGAAATGTGSAAGSATGTTSSSGAGGTSSGSATAGSSGAGSSSGGGTSTGSSTAGGSSSGTSSGSGTAGSGGAGSTAGGGSSTGTSTAGGTSGGTPSGSGTAAGSNGGGSTSGGGATTGSSTGAAPTVEMGITTILATTDSNDLGIFAQQVVATDTGAVQSLSFYIDPDSNQGGDDSVELGIYADDGGMPDALLAQTSSVLDPPPGAWLTLPTSPLTVDAGSYYWLAYEVSGPSVEYRTGSLGEVCLGTVASYGPMPAAFPACNLMGDPWSFYATIQP
ncbi:MAG TPA: hypothetical protein VMB50_14305 [Myxococcales bacterium]|nr:hypothetical protein [Myxococcales bacterium]